MAIDGALGRNRCVGFVQGTRSVDRMLPQIHDEKWWFLVQYWLNLKVYTNKTMYIHARCMYIYIYTHIHIHMGVVLNSFARKWLLLRPWANLARFLRNHCPVWLFGWAYFRAPFSCSFSCSFLVCIDLSIHFELISFKPKRKSKDKQHVQLMCVSVYLLRKYNFLLFYLHIVFPFPCVFDRAAWTTGQLWTWSVRVSFAKLARSLGWKTLSLTGLLLIVVNLHSSLPTWGLEHRNAWDSQYQPMLQIHKLDVE